MTRRLLLVGAGGLARETAAAALEAGHEVVGYLDEDPSRAGSDLAGRPVLGGLDALTRYDDAWLVLCPGRGTARAALAARLLARGVTASRFATVVHPAAAVAAGCRIGAGSIVLAGVVMTASVQVGTHVVVMPNVTLPHDVVAGDFATICSGVQLGGSVQVGSTAYVGMGACVREDLRIGAGALVGMGSVLLRDVPDGETWVGAPATRYRGRLS